MAGFRDDPVIQSVLQSLEGDRIAVAAAKRKSFIVMGAGAIIIALTVFLVSGLIWGYIAGGIVLIYGIVLNFKTAPAFNAYKNNFKLKVIGAALRDIDQSLLIEPDAGIKEREFIKTRLFDHTPDRYSSEDLVSGKADKTSFYFSEVDAEYKTEHTDNKGRKTETWHTIFKGILFVADFNKKFHGTTIVTARDLGGTVGSWIAKAAPIFFSSASKEVELENVDFNKTFITNSTDQIEARYILTPAMMDRLCELNSKCKNTISLSFIDSRVYIAFPLDENYFEPPLFKSILDPSCLERDIYIIGFMHGIVKELDLNTRIWGKE